MANQIASLYAVIGADLTGLNNGLMQARGDLQGFEAHLASAGKSARGLGIGLTATVTAPVIAMGKEMVESASAFEAATNILGVAARDSGTSLAELQAAALRAGGDTKLLGVDAMQSADAMTTFYKAGMSTKDILGDLQGYLAGTAEVGGAFRAAVDLAAASDIDLAQASDAVAIAMATFGLNAEDSAGIANAFVQAADASIAEVSDLTAALENVGPTAATFGWTLQETNQALAILSERGIRGAEAGTALKSMMNGLMSDSDKTTTALKDLGIALYDSTGTMRSLPDILADIEKGMSGMTEEQKNAAIGALTTSYGMKAMQTLLAEGTVGWQKMGENIKGAAMAQDVAGKRTQGMAAAMEQLKGAVQTFMITVGTPLIKNILTPLVKKLTDVFSWLANLDPKFLQIGMVVAGVAAAIGPLLIIFGQMAIAVAAIGAPVILVAAGIAALGAAFVAANGGIGPTIERLKEIGASISTFVRPILDELVAFWDWLWPHLLETFGPILGQIVAFAKPLLEDMKTFFVGVFGYIVDWVNTNMPLIKATIESVLNRIKVIWDEVWPYIASVLTAVWETMKGLIMTTINTILNLIKAGMLLLTGDWQDAWELLKTTVADFVIRLLEVIAGLFTRIGEIFKEQIEAFKAAGKALIMGMVDGIKGAASAVANAAKGVVTDAINGAKALLGIKSPSRVFEGIGANMMAGMTKGIEGMSMSPVIATNKAAAGTVRNATLNYADTIYVNDRAAMLQLAASRRYDRLTTLAEGAF